MAKKYAKKRVVHKKKRRGGEDFQMYVKPNKVPDLKEKPQTKEGAGRCRRKSMKKRRGGLNVPVIGDIPITSTISNWLQNNSTLKGFAPSVKENVPEDYLPSKLIAKLDPGAMGASSDSYLYKALKEAQDGVIQGLAALGMGRRRRRMTSKRRSPKKKGSKRK